MNSLKCNRSLSPPLSLSLSLFRLLSLPRSLSLSRDLSDSLSLSLPPSLCFSLTFPPSSFPFLPLSFPFSLSPHPHSPLSPSSLFSSPFLLPFPPLSLSFSQILSHARIFSTKARERGHKKLSVLLSLVSSRANAFACEGEKFLSPYPPLSLARASFSPDWSPSLSPLLFQLSLLDPLLCQIFFAGEISPLPWASCERISSLMSSSLLHDRERVSHHALILFISLLVLEFPFMENTTAASACSILSCNLTWSRSSYGVLFGQRRKKSAQILHTKLG